MSNHILKQSLSIIINVITFFCSSSTLFNGAKGLENWFRKNADLYFGCSLKNKSCIVPTRLFDSSYRDQFGVHSSSYVRAFQIFRLCTISICFQVPLSSIFSFTSSRCQEKRGRNSRSCEKGEWAWQSCRHFNQCQCNVSQFTSSEYRLHQDSRNGPELSHTL